MKKKIKDPYVHNINGISDNNKKQIFKKMCSFADIPNDEVLSFYDALKDKNSLIGIKEWSQGKNYLRNTNVNKGHISFCKQKSIEKCEMKNEIEDEINCSLYKSSSKSVCVPSESINIFNKNSIVESESGNLFKVIDYYEKNTIINNNEGVINTILFQKIKDFRTENVMNHEYFLMLPSGEICNTKEDSDDFPCKTVIEHMINSINRIYSSLSNNERKNMKVWLLGHSLGSALAQRMAYNILLEQNNKNKIHSKNIRLIVSCGYIHFTKKECFSFIKSYYGKYLSYVFSIQIQKKKNEDINDFIDEIINPDYFIFKKPLDDSVLNNENIDHKNMIKNVTINYTKPFRHSYYLNFRNINVLNDRIINKKIQKIHDIPIENRMYHFFKSSIRPFIEVM